MSHRVDRARRLGFPAAGVPVGELICSTLPSNVAGFCAPPGLRVVTGRIHGVELTLNDPTRHGAPTHWWNPRQHGALTRESGPVVATFPGDDLDLPDRCSATAPVGQTAHRNGRRAGPGIYSAWHVICRRLSATRCRRDAHQPGFLDGNSFDRSARITCVRPFAWTATNGPARCVTSAVPSGATATPPRDLQTPGQRCDVEPGCGEAPPAGRSEAGSQ